MANEHNRDTISKQGQLLDSAQYNTNTQGGDYAENTVDKHQGTFVTGNQYNIQMSIWMVAIFLALTGLSLFICLARDWQLILS